MNVRILIAGVVAVITASSPLNHAIAFFTAPHVAPGHGQPVSVPAELLTLPNVITAPVQSFVAASNVPNQNTSDTPFKQDDLTPPIESYTINVGVSDTTSPAGFGTSRGHDFSAIPVPTAVWLFGAGLIGLIAIARREGIAGPKNDATEPSKKKQ